MRAHEESPETPPNQRPTGASVLAAVLGLEAALVAAATVFLVVEMLITTPDSYASAIALTALAAVAAVFVAALCVNTLRGRAWVRAGTIVWQLLQIAVAVGSFQGLYARPDVGWLLLLPAIVALGLLFTRPVILWTSRRDG